jgi:plasmid maintenance system antidote protein VapI
LSEKHRISADTALQPAQYFGTSAQFWMNLQGQYELRQAQDKNPEVYKQIPSFRLLRSAQKKALGVVPQGPVKEFKYEKVNRRY